MRSSGKTRMACVVVLVHVMLGPVLLAQAVDGAPGGIDEQIRARRAKYQQLLQSVKPRDGQPKQPGEVTPSLLYRTRDGYVGFLLMPRSSHIEVAKPQDWKPEDVADAFVRQWKELLTSDSPSVQFKRTRSVQRQDYSIVTYRQQFAGLEVYAADLIIQVNKTGGVDAVHSDVMRDPSVFESKQVSLEPTIDPATARSRAVAWMHGDWKTRYRKDVDLKLSTSPPKLMIFAPSVVGKNGASRLVWQFELHSAVAAICEYVLLDAHNGDIVHHYSLIESVLPPNAERYIYDCNNTSTLPQNPVADPNQAADPNISGLFHYLGYSLEFFWEEHGRDGWDGSGSLDIRGYAKYWNPPDFPKDYAYYHSGDIYHPEGVYIGDWALACDLVCHEYTHGVQGHMKTLDGSGDSGALGEVIGDAWGEWIAQTYDASNNVAWELYENAPFTDPNHPGYLGQEHWRFMNNPPSANTHSSYGSDFGSVPQPDYRPNVPVPPTQTWYGNWYAGSQDDGGAHHNCGVGNKLTYLLTDGDTFNGYAISGFDISKTGDLYYECLDLIPMACDYPGFYFGLVHAATNLSFNSADRENIRRACEAVGICPPGELEAHWKLDETTGTTAGDSAGSNSGSVQGSAQWAPTSGRVGGALSFDGTDDYVSLSSISALQGRTASITAWVKPYALSGFRPLLTQYDDSSGNHGYYLCLDSGAPAFYLNDAGGSSGSVNADEWCHVAGTQDGVTLRVYVDGAFGDDFDGLNQSGINHAAYIGCSGTGNYFNGLIDDVRVYNYALSDNEIAGLSDYPSPPAFVVKNASGAIVALINDEGNLFLAGTLTQGGTPQASASDEFCVQKLEGQNVVIVAIINMATGDMVIAGTQQQGVPSPSNFIVKNSQGNAVAYIDASGNLRLAGNVYPNWDF